MRQYCFGFVCSILRLPQATMKRRSVVQFFLALASLLMATVAYADAIRIDQIWEKNRGFPAGPDPDNILEVRAFVEAGDVPDAGIFDVLLSDYTVLHRIDGVGQSFSRVLFPDPRGFDRPGDMIARFVDGAFDSIGITAPLGAIPQATVQDQSSFVNVGIRLGFDAPSGRAELIRLFSGSGFENFLLLSTQVTGQIGAVPEPPITPLLFLASGLLIARRLKSH